MTTPASFETTLRDRRIRRGWSQEELARQSGLSRAGVSAIENGRLIPSAAAALALAAALGCRVEDLFRLRDAADGARPADWAWPAPGLTGRFWEAEIQGSRIRYPVEHTATGLIPHDGLAGTGFRPDRDAAVPARTLVLAGCDPSVGLLADALARTANIRLIPLTRSSRAALDLLGRGLVHVAGVHLARADQPGGNAAVVRQTLGAGYQLLHAARWEEGIAHNPAARLRSVRSALGSSLRWVGRETGSGARQCLDELLQGRKPPRRLASDHRGVADAIRCGWADAGVCLRLVTEEAGLGYLAVRHEDYDLCFPESAATDHRIDALLQVLRSPSYRQALGDLPGYDSRNTGALQGLGSTQKPQRHEP